MTFSRKYLTRLGMALGVLAAAGVTFFLTSGCSRTSGGTNGSSSESQDQKQAGAGARVETVAVERQDLVHKVLMPGTVEGYETADLFAKVGGYLAEMNVDIGDGVRGPQRSVQLDGREVSIGAELRETLAALVRDLAVGSGRRPATNDIKEWLSRLSKWEQEQASSERLTDADKSERVRQARILRELAVSRSGNGLPTQPEPLETVQDLLDGLLGQPLAVLRIPEMHSQLRQKESLIRQAQSDVVVAQAAIEQAEADEQSAQASLEEARTEVAEKQAQWRYRQEEHNRYEDLVAGNAARRDQLDAARFQLAAADAALKTVQARIKTARAKLTAAGANLEKAKADYQKALANVEVARADYDFTRTMLDYATVRAPFDGQVTRRYLDRGAFVQPAEGNSAARPLLTVARTDVVRIAFDVPMNDVRMLDRGDRAILDRCNVLPGETFPGEVTRFSAALDKSSRMLRVEIDIPNNDGRLRPGYYGYVTVFLQEAPGTPVIPSSALLSDGQEKFCYVVENDGRARKQVVTTNYQDGTIIGIASGLKGGEKVVKAGGGQITDGQMLAVLAN